jgi:hypothetical protein
MLVTTLGRIERIEDILKNWELSEYYTAADRVRLEQDLEKENEKLRKYNNMAYEILDRERAGYVAPRC